VLRGALYVAFCLSPANGHLLGVPAYGRFLILQNCLFAGFGSGDKMF